MRHKRLVPAFALAACASPGGSGGGVVGFDVTTGDAPDTRGASSWAAPDVAGDEADGGADAAHDTRADASGPDSSGPDPRDTTTAEIESPETSCIGEACPCDGSVAVTGRLELGNPFAFDRASAELIHKRDVDTFEDGCIAHAEIRLQRGEGCIMTLVGRGAISEDGDLRVDHVLFQADSLCPGFPDDIEGVYSDPRDLDVRRLRLATTRVPDINATESCVTTTLEIDLAGTLRDGSGNRLEIAPSHFRLSGRVHSTGSFDIACPCVSVCGAESCGDDGCGGSCGACEDGEYCDAVSRRCECAPDCEGKDCGDDGCGGSCGECDGDTNCDGGVCSCQPSCGGRTCEDDGCGNSCGACGPTESCAGGQCVPNPELAECDGQCTWSDSQMPCPNDCCGNGVCDPLERRVTCESDCAWGCGDGRCAPDETVDECPYDCNECGDGFCGAFEYFNDACFWDCF